MVHCHMPMSGVVARLAAKDVQKRTGRKIPVLYTAHGFHFCSGEALKNWIYYPIERYLARYTDRLIVINQEDYKRASKFPTRGTVEYVPGVGVNVNLAENMASNASKADVRKVLCQNDVADVWEVLHENGVKISERIAKKTPDTKVLVAIGELNENKNHCLLLEMMSELKDLDLMCVICGTGNQMESLEQQIEERQLQGRVILAGYVNDVTQVLQSADCFVLPSKREGLPVVVMEAMAQGLPVIACEIRGVTDLIEHTKGGYLVKRNDAVDFAVKVRRLFTEKEGKSAVPREIRRQQMGEWNRKRVQAFSKEVVEQRMREIYQSLE